MEPILRSLILERFRSIPAETVQFANPTFLVGRNGSGKSNFGGLVSDLVSSLYSEKDLKLGLTPPETIDTTNLG